MLVAGCLAVLATDLSGGRRPLQPLAAVLEIQREGLRLVYHLPTGRVSLFDLTADPRALRNVAGERPQDLERLRAALAAEHGVDDLEALRARSQNAIDSLRQLGYL